MPLCLGYGQSWTKWPRCVDGFYMMGRACMQMVLLIAGHGLNGHTERVWMAACAIYVRIVLACRSCCSKCLVIEEQQCHA